MACIAYVYGEGEFSSRQIKELIIFAEHFNVHISPWVFDKNEERKNLNDLANNPKQHDMTLFLTMSILNLGQTVVKGIDVVNHLINQNIQVMCLQENIDTSTKEGLEEYYHASKKMLENLIMKN